MMCSLVVRVAVATAIVVCFLLKYVAAAFIVSSHKSKHVRLRNDYPRHHCATQQEDLDAIVRDMGLIPVTPKNKKKTTAKGKRKSQSRKQQRPPHQTSSPSSGQTPNVNISLETQLQFARNGHAVLRNFLDPTMLKQIRTDLQAHAKSKTLDAWIQKLEVARDRPVPSRGTMTVKDCQKELQELGITSLPFLQLFNTWRTVASVRDNLCLSSPLAKAASILVDVPSIRLYQDALFWKRAGDGPTPWHSDARMAPFDTSHMITFWIPLEPITVQKTGLQFVDKSHADFALAYWNPPGTAEYERLEKRYDGGIRDYMPLALGDVTVHGGWTLHCASENTSPPKEDRWALAITYVDAHAEVREDALATSLSKGDSEDQWSYQSWVSEVPPRSYFEHELVPIVWPPPQDYDHE